MGKLFCNKCQVVSNFLYFWEKKTDFILCFMRSYSQNYRCFHQSMSSVSTSKRRNRLIEKNIEYEYNRVFNEFSRLFRNLWNGNFTLMSHLRISNLVISCITTLKTKMALLHHIRVPQYSADGATDTISQTTVISTRKHQKLNCFPFFNNKIFMTLLLFIFDYIIHEWIIGYWEQMGFQLFIYCIMHLISDANGFLVTICCKLSRDWDMGHSIEISHDPHFNDTLKKSLVK